MTEPTKSETKTKSETESDADKKFTSFAEFYPFYLSEHSNQTSRRLHFIGTSIGFILILTAILTRTPMLILYGVLQGYVFAWVGHFYFEHNRPATFKYPFYSFAGDWHMWADMWRGKIRF